MPGMPRRHLAWLAFVAAAFAAYAACAAKPPLRVSAAISLQAWLAPTLLTFEKDHPGTKVEASYAASGVLERQIEAGAPVDVFLSASPAEIDRLALRAPLPARATVARNRLVLALGQDAGAVHGVRDLISPSIHRIALGRPKSVPAGRYAQETLERLGLWQTLLPKLIYADNVAEVRAWVARGDAEAGFVYRNEATGLPTAVELPEAPAVELVAALLPGASPQGRGLFDFLTSRDRGPSLQAAGLLPP
jgi:molybdate transport system substrate-binding protein